MSDWSRIDVEDVAQGEVKPGVRVELVHTSDEHTRLVPGVRGLVRRVRQDRLPPQGFALDVDWDDGSSLSLLEGAGDLFKLVRAEPVTLALTDEAKAGLAALVATELEDLEDGRGAWQANQYAGPSDGRGRAEDGSVWYEQLRRIYQALTGEAWQDPFAEPKGLLDDGR